MRQFSTYHRVLRVFAVVFAVVLMFESGVVSRSTAELSKGTEVYLANAIGMSAAVKPTELNQYTAALTQRERELDAREMALREREITVNIQDGEMGSTNDATTYILASILFILLLLILLNYTLDYLRAREEKDLKTV